MSKKNVISHYSTTIYSNDIYLSNIHDIRDYIFIDDVIEIILKCLNENISGVFNVGYVIGTSVDKLAKIFL